MPPRKVNLRLPGHLHTPVNVGQFDRKVKYSLVLYVDSGIVFG